MTTYIRVWYAAAVAFIACAAFAFGSVVYTNHVQQTADRRWCELLSTWDDALKQSPPTTASGQRIAPRISEMRREFGCPMPK